MKEKNDSNSTDEQNAQQIIDFLEKNFPENAHVLNEVIVVNYGNLVSHGMNLQGLNEVEMLAVAGILYKLFENLLKKVVDKPIETVQNELFDGKNMDYDTLLQAFLNQERLDELAEDDEGEEEEEEDDEGEEWKKGK